MDCIRSFELEQMSYSIRHCLICNERRVEMKMSSENECLRCHNDKGTVKMFSNKNFMDPLEVPEELRNLTLIEQQLISRISPIINVHLLKHGGIAANGHCVTFPQCINEPAQILPLLPEEIKIIRVRKCGSVDSFKEYNVRRAEIEYALHWLKSNNPAFSDITISQDRLTKLPQNGPIQIQTIETTHDIQNSDKGPAKEQNGPGEVQGETNSCVGLPDLNVDIKHQVEQVVKEVVGPEHGKVTVGRKYVCIPWPTQSDTPLSEFTTRYFFSMAFPCLFPYSKGDFHINRPRTITSMTEWAEHLMWYGDGRFAQHPYFKFIVHNIIMRKRTFKQSSYVVKQHLGEEPITFEELKDMLQRRDNSVAQKVMYFGACLRGTTQY
ncbi:uncharacterized protein LOC128552332 [Mercenaria mercenaria]|uniref:uncharacterized protein LOC128552332 n=1 Tax=Mercenaria mercenaria TaxID=6596 RepID=UPI00234EF3F8|nr:uncharacterized protein LOC128552332 [Mercenaria mercenaria]